MSIQYIVCFKRNGSFNYPDVAGSPDPAIYSTEGLPSYLVPKMRIELEFVSSFLSVVFLSTSSFFSKPIRGYNSNDINPDTISLVYLDNFMTRIKPSPLVTALTGILLAAGLTAVITLTASRLAHFNIIGPTAPFHYPWRLIDPTTASHLTAWLGYALHNILAWVIIYLAKRARPGYKATFHRYNWGMLAVNGFFILLHWLQSQVWYDGLAQDVPEVTALGSVALMLMIIIILETPRRGLILGRKVRFHKQFIQIVRQYHGYLFTWACIYTFWYHPTEGTVGHLAGFFYMFLLLWQSVLIFNRTHLNKWWTFTLEVLVLPHAVLVALNQGNNLWPMFAFGFGAMLILVQMHGLGLNTWTKRILAILFVVAVVISYGISGRLADVHEITRIPILDYAVIGLFYLIFLGLHGISRLMKPALPLQADRGDE